MASPMDNDLLDLWLKAGSLTRDQVRDIITGWQGTITALRKARRALETGDAGEEAAVVHLDNPPDVPDANPALSHKIDTIRASILP